MEARVRRRARWAPWWAYAIAIVVTNQLRVQWLQPEDLATWLEVVIGVGAMALVAAVVTAAWRMARR
jgi:hypothetical protein